MARHMHRGVVDGSGCLPAPAMTAWVRAPPGLERASDADAQRPPPHAPGVTLLEGVCDREPPHAGAGPPARHPRPHDGSAGAADDRARGRPRPRDSGLSAGGPTKKRKLPQRSAVVHAAPDVPPPPAATHDVAEGGCTSRHLKRRMRHALCSKRLRRVVLELFAGSAHLTEALKRRGLPALALDLTRGAAEDHLSREFRSVLKGWLAGRVAGAVWLGTPCTTWTQALRHPLRTRTRPMGRADLSPHEAAEVRVGNRTFHSLVM